MTPVVREKSKLKLRRMERQVEQATDALTNAAKTAITVDHVESAADKLDAACRLLRSAALTLVRERHEP